MALSLGHAYLGLGQLLEPRRFPTGLDIVALIAAVRLFLRFRNSGGLWELLSEID
jgi:hypothetical protein